MRISAHVEVLEADDRRKAINAEDRDQLVFVEVRSRSQNNYGTAADTITRRKQRRIILAAQYYLHKHRLTEKISCRFDVVAINVPVKPRSAGTFNNSFGNRGNEIKWLKDAFNTDI